MADRDPRTEPSAGDIVTNGTQTFYVTRVEAGEVFYTEDHPPLPKLSVDIDEWRAFSRTDTVISGAKVP